MLKDHNGFIDNGDIVGYESYGSFYGGKILKAIYVEEIGQYRYLIQFGEVKANEFKAYQSGKDLALFAMETIKDSYGKIWTKGPEVKDGDILRSGSGDHIFVVRGEMRGEPQLYRVSGGSGLFDTYSNYVNQYGALRQVYTLFSTQIRFSEPVK